MSEKALLFRFFELLSDLSRPAQPRSASELRDYVAAVWVDCPRYELPLSYKSWDLPALLENAVRQLEKNFGYTLAVSFPSDLSTVSGSVAPGFWRPASYLSEHHILNSVDVYEPILPRPILNPKYPDIVHERVFTTDPGNEDLFITDITVNLRRFLGSTATEYPQIHGPENAYKTIKDLYKMTAHWPLSSKWNADLRCQQLTEQHLRDAFSPEAQLAFDSEAILNGVHILSNRDADACKEWAKRLRGNSDFDCYAFAFSFVALTLGIDPVVARRRGLLLVATNTDPKHIGLEVGRDKEVDEHQRNKHIPSQVSRRTILLGGDEAVGLGRPLQTCDVRQIESAEWGINREIEIIWVPWPRRQRC